jgi:hypothetical protein
LVAAVKVMETVVPVPFFTAVDGSIIALPSAGLDGVSVMVGDTVTVKVAVFVGEIVDESVNVTVCVTLTVALVVIVKLTVGETVGVTVPEFVMVTVAV